MTTTADRRAGGRAAAAAPAQRAAAPPGQPADQPDPAPAAPPAPGPRGLPLLGSVVDFRRDILAAMSDGARRHGDLTRYRLGPLPVHGVSSPELAERVLTDSATFGKLGPENPLRLVLGDGLLTSSDHDSWLRNRRMMQPVFARSSIGALYDTMLDCTRRGLAQLDAEHAAGDVVDLHTELMRTTLDIVSRAMFGADVLGDLDAIGPRAVDVAVNYAFSRLQNPFSPPVAWPTPANRRFAAVMRDLDALVYRLIAERRAAAAPRGDLLDMLLAARDADTGERMSDRQLRDEVLTMFAAGHETTAITLTWTFYLLSRHGEIRRALQRELDEVLDGALPALADLPRLPLTLAVFEEAMRLYPSAPILPRRTQHATTLGGHHLPAGSRVLVDLHLVHRHPAHWAQPERFDPSRFLPGQGRRPAGSPPRVAGPQPRAAHRYAYLPFGAGPHLCIGKHFALMEAQLLLAAIAARYELRHVPGHRAEPHATITLRPRHGMLMTLHPRRPGAGR